MLLTCSVYILKVHNNFSWSHFLSRLKNPNCQPVLMPQPSAHLCGFLWTCSNTSTLFLWSGPQNRTQHPKWGLTRAEQKGRITSLDLLATFLTLPRTWSPNAQFFIHQHLSFSLQGCFQLFPPPVCIAAGDFPDPEAGLCTWLCGKSWCSLSPSEIFTIYFDSSIIILRYFSALLLDRIFHIHESMLYILLAESK